MINVASEFLDGEMAAISRQSDEPNELWTGFFDFALVGTSWDRRCIALTKCTNLKVHSVVDVVPFVEEFDELLERNRKTVRHFFGQYSEVISEIRSKPAELEESLSEIRAHLWTAINAVGRDRPARVLIDVSTCPRYFSLAILAEAFRSGLVGEIVIAYSEGRYPDAAPSYEDLEDISFTDGAFQSVAIPGFFGEFEPRKGVYFLVSTGFDGWKTLNLLVRKEPDRVMALVASPGVSPDYERRALIANAALFQRFGVYEAQMIKAQAGDAIQAWRKISEANSEDFAAENIFYLCSGNKAHSVALALRAMARETPTLLYNRPAQHLPSDVECSGMHWAYSVSPIAGTVFGK